MKFVDKCNEIFSNTTELYHNFDDVDEQSNKINHPALSNISDRFFMDGL